MTNDPRHVVSYQAQELRREWIKAHPGFPFIQADQHEGDPSLARAARGRGSQGEAGRRTPVSQMYRTWPRCSLRRSRSYHTPCQRRRGHGRQHQMSVSRLPQLLHRRTVWAPQARADRGRWMAGSWSPLGGVGQSLPPLARKPTPLQKKRETGLIVGIS